MWPHYGGRGLWLDVLHDLCWKKLSEKYLGVIKTSDVPCRPHAQDWYSRLFHVRRRDAVPCGGHRDAGACPCGGGDLFCLSLFCGRLFPS